VENGGEAWILMWRDGKSTGEGTDDVPTVCY
jgi:hypothetical protein